MALPANIQQFKSSGVYRLEFDKSQLINIPAETIRLVIGYSNKGPFNTPIFVPDAQFFRDVYGDIDNGLELKGSYFHRSCLTALDRGPILALNLMRLEDDVTAEYRAMSAQSDMINKVESSTPVKNFFNRDKFWFIDDEAVISAINAGSGTSTILNFANAGKKTFSVFTVKSPITGFDVTAEEWYGSGKTPPFLDKSSWISDFLVRTIILDGDFSNYQALSIDPIYGAYFDTSGLKATINDAFGNQTDGLDALMRVPEVNVLAEYTGSLIPEFQDKDGTNLFIEDIINNETSKTGLVCAINKDWFYDNPSSAVATPIIDGLQIDLVGHGVEKSSNSVIDFLSYYGPKNSKQPYQAKTKNNALGATSLSTFVFDGTGTPFYTLSSSGTYGATGGANIMTVYGPNHPAVTGGTASTIFTGGSAQGEFETFAGSVIANRSYVTAGITGASAITSPGATFNAAKVVEASVSQFGIVKDTLEIRISDVSEDGTVGGSATNAWFTLGLEAGQQSAAGTLDNFIEVLPSLDYTVNPGTTYASMYGGPQSSLFNDAETGIITTGDNIQGATLGSPLNPVRVEILTTNDLHDLCRLDISIAGASAGDVDLILSHSVANAKVTAFTDATYTTETGILPSSAPVPGFEDQWIGIPQGGATGATYDESVYIGTLAGDINEVYSITQSEVVGPNELHLDNGSQYLGELIVGQFLIRGFESVSGSGAYDQDVDPRTGTSRLTRILSARYDGATASPTFDKFIVKTQDAIWTYPDGTGQATAIERYSSITDFVTNYTVTSLEGYTIPDYAKPLNTNIRMNEILDVMYDTNIAETLEDRDAITFRYIVDTFNHGIEPSSKARLSKIAKGRMNAFAILNSPSVKEFKKSTDPKFNAGLATSTFDPRFIATGGNLSLNPNNIYSLPSIADGGNYCGFYTPNLRIIEKGATKFVPPAAHISNLFIDKYNLALPWSIVAGPRRGVVAGTGVAGVEYEFDRRALDEIEPFGLNAVINKRGFGLVINANQTAQQTVKSALSQIHVRELLIYIEDGIAEILKNYRWEFNTAQNRLEIKTLADNFLAQILNDGGLYDFNNVMDTTNNTTEVIDNNIGIIDTYVEPVRGMGILVNRVTILSTGSIQAGNF